MTAPKASEPTTGVSTPASPRARSGLARTSFVLALVPLIAVGLMVAGFLLAPDHAAGIILLVLCPACWCASISAIVTAGVALRWANKHPLWPGGQDLDQAGLVIGIVDIVITVGITCPILFLGLCPVGSPGGCA